MGRSKLKLALAAEKGIDAKKIQKIKEKKKHKQRVQKKTGKRGGVVKPDETSDREDDGADEDDEELDADEVDGGALIDQEASEASEEDEEGDEEEDPADLAALDESDSSDTSMEFEKKIERPKKPKATVSTTTTTTTVAVASKNDDASEDEDEDEDEEEDPEEDIALSDLDDLPEEERAELHALTRKRTTINNTSALLAALHRIAIVPPPSADAAPQAAVVPFAVHQSVTASGAPTGEALGEEEVQDDLKRELAFYAQSLAAARLGRTRLRAEGVPFARPTDYFAEMAKDDGHMERVRAKLVDEASAKRAAQDARKLRDLKKFGKQVQSARLQERAKEKRDTLDKIKTLKRKRQESSGADLGTREADLFDVGVDSELSRHHRKGSSNNKDGFGGGRGAGAGAGGGGGPNAKRQKKNEKYGFGGKKRHAKSGDAVSSGDLSGFSARRMKQGGGGGGGGGGAGGAGRKPPKARLGKSRRNAGAAKG
ncbi:eukaryotic rRNA processing protein EBP2-domain-containing protein [Xylariaceae sp. FL0804]|nr:eukaryotic rRNA processing protein EBP2-domain-containing protein [Xylariaceae sp. FL0804]